MMTKARHLQRPAVGAPKAISSVVDALPGAFTKKGGDV